MNIVKRHVYILEFDTWEPFEKDVTNELDELRNRLKCGHILGHAAKVRLAKQSEVRLCQENQTEQSA